MLKKQSPKADAGAAGRWTLRDHNGSYLLITKSYGEAAISFYLGPKTVYAWTGLENASLVSLDEGKDLRSMFPAGSVTLVEILRREAA